MFPKSEHGSFWYYGEYSTTGIPFSAVHLEDNRAFDIFSTSGRLGVFGDRQSREVLLCRNCQGVFRKIPSTSLKLAGRSSGATSSSRAADEYICGLEKRSHVFVRNGLQASFRIRTSQTARRLIAEFSLSTFRMPDSFLSSQQHAQELFRR